MGRGPCGKRRAESRKRKREGRGSGRKGDSPHLPERPKGCFAQMGTVPFLRPAFTLIEMLVVVAIMMVLVAAAATRMRPASESRRIREAARA